ncbi:hypothetical protein CDL12_09565 [Handroanthus impetiginosus]|uniref:Uncharacterized protein n=1 Tax=Handroanthus impetiginosus TaxID=429701 RepID=A0A2G9HJR7_9LAMI|nr:hypothetical protein CDL12_09565 [Handroanthus impetiginosus]
MAKRRRELDSDGITAETAEYTTVFVDSSLDTHIAMLVSSSDTVSDFKKKLVSEHMQCFPKIGEIQIHSLKVKRKANYYHLTDIMLVWSAFHGVKGSWFLSADASGPPACQLNQNFLELGTSSDVKINVRNADDDCRSLSSDVNRIQTLPTSLADGVTENNVVSEMIDGFKVEKSLEKDIGSHSHNYSQVNCMGTESRPKKKRKMRHTKDVCHDPSGPSLEEGPHMFHASGKDASMSEIVVGGNSTVDAVKEGPEGVILYEQQGKPILSEADAEVGVRNDQSNIEDRVAPGGTAPAMAEKNNLGRGVDSQNLLVSDGRKEDTVSESIIPEKLESEHDQDVPAEQPGSVSVKLPDVPARSINAGSATGDGCSDGSKGKKKKSQRTNAKIQDTTGIKQTRKSESTKPDIETHELEKKEEERDLSLNHDHGIIMPSNSKASVHADPKETSFSPHLSDSNAMEPDVSTGSKKKMKKRGTKSANTNLEKSGTEQTDNGISGSSGLLFPSTKHISEETDKGESISCHKEKDLQMKLLDDSTKDASEKGQGANTNTGDCVISTQAEQTSVDVITEEEESQNSVGDRSAAIGKENPVVDINQVEKEREHTEIKDKKTKKKIKDVQMKSSNGSTKDDSEMPQGVNTDEENLAISTQTKQTLEDGITEEKKTEKDQSSADNRDVAIGKENQIVEFNQVEKDSKSAEGKEKKAKKKIKKRKAMASDVQENLPIKDQKVGNEVLTNEVNSIGLVNSEEEVRHVATSQVVSHKSKEKPEELHESAVNPDDLARTSENGGEGINFKQYFLPGQYQDQVDSSDEVKKATKSNEEMNRKKVKENGLPSLSISTKLQNSLNSFDNHEGENKYRVKKKSGKRQGNSAQNSDREEVIPNSTKRSLKVSENGMKDSSPSEMQETILKKSNEILAASSYPKKKKPSLDISSSERSTTVPKNSGNKKLQSGLNVTNKMAMNAPKRSSLLSKGGALFQDSSSGGSEDENETVRLNVRTHSPSDTSSLSDYSVGESDLSQDSPRNVTNDANRRSSRGNGMSKLDLSASKDMTMDMILRSSKRFKKAKRLVDSQIEEQNESQQVEFVPESQPI